MMKIKLLAGLAAIALAGPALAQSSQLTPADTAKLQVSQDKMEAKEAKAKPDGKAASKEKTRKVAKAQNKQGKKSKKKQDKQATASVK